MKTCATILKNAHVLAMDEDSNQFEPGAIAIKDGKIAAVGYQHEILAEWQAEETIDCGGKVLMPGLINTHTHIPMTLLRGLANDLRLDVWLMGYMMPVEREFVSPEFVRLGTQMGCAELIRSGVTTFNDMYYFEDEVAQATAEIGMRAVLGQTVLKFPSPDAASFEDSLALSEALIEKWKDHNLIIPAIAPHAVYTCPAEVLEAVVKIAKKHDAIVHFHVSETIEEVETMYNKYIETKCGRASIIGAELINDTLSITIQYYDLFRIMTIKADELFMNETINGKPFGIEDEHIE